MEVKRISEKRSSQAILKLDEASKEQRKADKFRNYNSGIAEFHQDYANDLRKEAKALLAPDYPATVGAGVEAVPSRKDGSLSGIRETMEDPDMINLDASTTRLELLAETNVLPLGIDVAESIQAKNSVEKMLAHQMATAHVMVMQLLAKIQRAEDTVDISRLTNASARLMTTFQEAIKVLQKMRSGGRQIVTVQHVNVSDGGQAVVSGNIKTGGEISRGGGNEK